VIESREKEIAELNTVLDRVAETKNQTEIKLREQQAVIESREKEIAELNTVLDRVAETKNQTEIKLREQQQEIDFREKKINELKAALTQVEINKSQIEKSLIDRQLELERQEKKIVELNAALFKIEENKNQVENSLREKQSELKAREKKIQELNNALVQMDETRRRIKSELEDQIDAQQIKLEEMEGKLRLTFVDKILFDTGSVEISKEGQELMSKLAESLKKNKDQRIIIEGHTDDRKIGLELRERYPTNWELSVARATSVLRYLEDKAGIDPERCVASGYSYYQPVASNDTEEGRSQNRRIEIILAPQRE
jgi:chemotaxis protein MotB